MRQQPLHGSAYGDWLEAATASAARAASISSVPFGSGEAACAAVTAFERLHHVLARHLRFVAGPRTGRLHTLADRATEEFATAVEAAAARYVKVRAVTTHPAGKAWDASADALGMAHDILATHLGPDRRPLTWEGELVLNTKTRWHLVVRLAELAQVLDQQRAPLLCQLAASAELARSPVLELHRIRLQHPGIELAAAAVLDTAHDHSGRPGLERVDPAPLTSLRDLPGDPLERALALTDSLRRFAYEQACDGAGGLGTDGLRSYAAHAVDVAGHAAAILRAADARAIDLFGRHAGTLARRSIERVANDLRAAGRQWKLVYRRWDDIASLHPTPRLLHHHVALTRQALSAATRDGAHPKQPVDLLPDAATAARHIDATSRLIAHLAPLARYQLATAQRMQTAADLLASVDTVAPGGRAANGISYAPLTYWPFERISTAYTTAANVGARAVAELEPVREALLGNGAAAHRTTAAPAAGLPAWRPTISSRWRREVGPAPTPKGGREIGL